MSTDSTIKNGASARPDIATQIEDRDHDAGLLEQAVYAKIEESLGALRLRESSVDWEDVLNLLREGQGLIEREGMAAFQARLQDKAGNPDAKKIDAYCHLHNVMQTVRSYTPVLGERSLQMETHGAFENLKAAIKEMKAVGYTKEEVVKFFVEVKISKSFTAHPTETLSPTGIQLCKKLVTAAEHEDAFARHDAIVDVIGQMVVCTNFGAGKKGNILEQIDSSDSLARVHNEGCNTLERYIADIITGEYGDAEMADKIRLDLAPRSWDYDSDGNNVAEGWAMLSKMSGTTIHAIEDTLAYMEMAQNEEAGLALNDSFQQLFIDLSQLHANLDPIYLRARDITTVIANVIEPEQKAAIYKENYAEMQNLTTKFGEIYNFKDKDRGFHFYTDVLTRLHEVEGEVARSPDAALYINEAYRTLRRNGFVLEKGQTRQNDIVHTQIIDNLFNSADFRARGVLESHEFLDIDTKGKFSALVPDQQNRLLEKVNTYCEKNGNRKQIRDDLFSANPLSFDKGGNGYPRQERTLLDRFKLRSLYPLKFDQGIISDSGDLGPTRQMFIADIFGMSNMRHMPLHEDRLTLSRQAELMATFQRFGGREGIDRRRHLTMKDPLWNSQFTGREVHDLPIMRPCSDAERGGGSATRLEAFQSFRDNIQTSYDTRTPVEIMLGGGLSMGRWGSDVGIPRRVQEQKLKEIAVERGVPFSHSDKTERRIMRAALAILYTEQGRAKRYYTATPGQVADDFANKIAEMIRGRLDLEGRVPDYTYIQRPGKMSPGLAELAPRLRDKAIDDFMKLRFAVSGDSNGKDVKEIITNKLGRKITAPNIISYMNNGARPASKTGKQEMTDVRAIENNERDYLSQLHAGGYYGAGNLMQTLWRELHDTQSPVVLEDIHDLINHPEWDFNYFTKNVADAGRADFAHALAKTGWADATFDDLIAVGKSIRFVKPRGQDSYRMVFDNQGGKITDEQAYIARIFYDRTMFLGMLEASLNTKPSNGPTMKSTQASIIESMRPDDNAPSAEPGPLTQDRYKASMAIVAEHKKNMAGYAVEYMLEDHITARIEAGEKKEAIIESLGGERFMRRAASAYRAGTVPHWPLWTGAVTYGVNPAAKPQPEPRPHVVPDAPAHAQ